MLPLPTTEERVAALLSALDSARANQDSDLAWEVMVASNGDIANRAAEVVAQIEDEIARRRQGDA